MLAKDNENDSTTHLATKDITVKRNYVGRQLGRHTVQAPFGESMSIPMTFIRAPIITKTKSNVTVLSTVDGNIVSARQDNQLVTAFHPELTNSTVVHKYFLEMCKRQIPT